MLAPRELRDLAHAGHGRAGVRVGDGQAQGVGGIKLNMPESIAFYVMPTSFEELEKQISEHYKDDEASIQRRLNKAKMDMEIAPLFRNIVYNDDPDKAYRQIKEKVLEEMEKR